MMKKITEFTSPLKEGFEAYADGEIWCACQGEDYQSQRAFLTTMTKWAGRNGFTVERVVSDNRVEFRFLPADPVVAVAEAAMNEKKEEAF